MERLSDKRPCNMTECKKRGQCRYVCNKYAKWIDDITKSLSAYEDAEERGLIVRLPCRVGDSLYEICFDKILEHEALYIEIREGEIYIVTAFFYEGTEGFLADNIGKTVFLTCQEAEKALGAMK